MDTIIVTVADSPEYRTERQVRSMLHVVPERIRKGSYQDAIAWKQTVADTRKALEMRDGPKRTAAIGRALIALTAMGGVCRDS